MNARLRPATDADADDIRRWRNHPAAREVSFTTHEIGPDEHRAWWWAVRADPTREVLVYEFAGRAAGSVTFGDIDHAAGTAKWGCSLDVDGLGRELLPAWLTLEALVVDHAFDELGLRVLGGEVLLANHQVWRLHQRFGFTEVRRYTREVDGVPQPVLWMELPVAQRKPTRARKSPES